MAEVLFYHLTATPLERSLPDILSRALQRDWRVVVRAGSDAQLAAVDDMLWCYDDASFLPHGTAALGHADQQPIYLTTDAENPAQATVLMLVEGARIDPVEVSSFERTCLMFNGNAPDALEAARADWITVRDAGLPGKYWAQVEGKWVEKAATPSATA